MPRDDGVRPVTGLAGEEAATDQGTIFEAPALLRILWADPQHTAEHLALWSVKRFAGRASSAVERLRSSNVVADDPPTLQRTVVARQTRVAMAEGALVGGPFIVLIPFAFCAALLAQAQMILELAALAGYAPDDEMRAADLLVLQRAYPSEEEAQAALRRVKRDLDRSDDAKLPRGTRWPAIKRMALLLGVLGSDEEKPSRFREILQWTFLVLVFLVGLVLPLVWVPYMAVSMRRSTVDIGERGAHFYEHRRSVDAGVAVHTGHRVHVPIAGTLLRTVTLVVLPILVALIALLFGVRLGTGKWLTAGLLLILASAVITAGWLAFRWWRRRAGAR